MAVVGSRQTIKGTGYNNHQLSPFAKVFNEVANSILTESNLDIYSETGRVILNESARDTLEQFYLEDSCDVAHMSPAQIKDHQDMMRESFLNDIEAIREYAPIGSFNPVMGMVFPLHKNLMMSTIWDNGVINKAVAVSPKFNISMEIRMLVDINGNEIDLYKNQRAIKAAMDQVAPYTQLTLTLPEIGTTDILDLMGATRKDNLSITTHISAFTTAHGTFPTKIETKPTYGEFDRGATVPVIWDQVDNTVPLHPVVTKHSDVLNFTMKNNKLNISSLKGGILSVVVSAKKDTSNGLVNTPTVKWTHKSDIIEIPAATPINTTISPEEVKDVAALYNQDVMANYKDDTIKECIDTSFVNLPADSKESASFNFKPPTGYALDFVSWRRETFFDVLDTFVTKLLQKLNDPNMTVNIIGRPDIIRKVNPTTYDFKSPSAIGPVELEFSKTVVTSDKRVYQFISSQKITDDELIIILNPRNSERIVYRIYDYQLYVSNDVRNAANPTLPAVHAFERWIFNEYQPIQGRFTIENPDGGYVN